VNEKSSEALAGVGIVFVRQTQQAVLSSVIDFRLSKKNRFVFSISRTQNGQTARIFLGFPAFRLAFSRESACVWMTRNMADVFSHAMGLHVNCPTRGMRVGYGRRKPVKLRIFNCSRYAPPSSVQRLAAKRGIHQILVLGFVPLEKCSKFQWRLVAVGAACFCLFDIECCHFPCLVNCV
jgi:hypothetical protein